MRFTSLFLLSTLIAPLVGCDSATRDVDSDPMSPAFVAVANHEWGPAVKLEPTGPGLLNTTALEGCPHEAPDGRRLYFASDRNGSIDVWYSDRQGNGAWGTPQPLPAPVNSLANDFCPTALPGRGLLFVSTRSDLPNCGTGTADIYQTHQDAAGNWAVPVNLGCTVNSSGNEFSPSLVQAGGGMLFFSTDIGGRHAIYQSKRGPDGAWGTPAPVAALNMAGSNSIRPNVSQDGRTIVFDSDRPNSAGLDVWYSHRATPFAAWTEPLNAGGSVNSPAAEVRASLSRDGKRPYFGSSRDGTSDLWVAERR